MKIPSISLALVVLFQFASATELNAQSSEKVLITHSSDSVSITPLREAQKELGIRPR